MPEADEDYADALLAAALRYAAGGLYVFPAFVERSDPVRHAKTARFIGQWRKESSADPATIRGWWGPGGPWRGAHICIDTGKSGLVVLDADGPDAIESVEDLIGRAGLVGMVPTEVTPTGGAHYWFRESYRNVIGNSASLVAPAVDVRGMGGLVYAAPSRDSAGAYRWLGPGEPDFAVHDVLPVVPPAIIELTKRQVNPPLSAPESGTESGAESQPAPFELPARQFTRQQAIDFCAPSIRALRAAPVGTINSRLNDAAKALSHFVPVFWAAETATASLLAALDSTVYDGQTWRAEDTIASAFRSAASDWRAELVPDPFASPEGAPPEPSLVDALDAEFLTPDQVVDRPPPTPLILDWLDLDSLAWLIGKPGSYKSFLVLDWAAHVGAGLPWRGHRVVQGDVDYIVAEGVTGMSLRVRAWQERHGPMKGVRFLPRPVQASGPEWAVLVEVERRHKPKLVILDTQARVTVGMDENDNTEMGRFIHRAEEIRAATGACVLVVHHIGRNGEDARGASALDGAQSTEIKIARSDRGPLWAVLSQDKQKDMAEAEPVEVGLDLVDLGIDGQTGRRLSSLVLAPVDPFETAGPPAKVPDFKERAVGNQAELLAAMREIFPTIGASYTRLAQIIAERRAEDQRPGMPKQSFGNAWNALIRKEIFIKVSGAERYVVNPDHDGNEGDAG